MVQIRKNNLQQHPFPDINRSRSGFLGAIHSVLEQISYFEEFKRMQGFKLFNKRPTKHLNSEIIM